MSLLPPFQWLPCQAPGVKWSVLGLVGLVSVYCDWVRWKIWSATSVKVWQHVKLSQQIHPWDTLACCWDVKQQTNKSPCIRSHSVKTALLMLTLMPALDSSHGWCDSPSGQVWSYDAISNLIQGYPVCMTMNSSLVYGCVQWFTVAYNYFSNASIQDTGVNDGPVSLLKIYRCVQWVFVKGVSQHVQRLVDRWTGRQMDKHDWLRTSLCYSCG